MRKWNIDWELVLGLLAAAFIIASIVLASYRLIWHAPCAEGYFYSMREFACLQGYRP